ncbi:DcaP family trimeric outer membrane transporter [Marinobacter salexigens]|uniref:Porin n=1 Tax=Marinobacter salexigens TaxID=1925763 RepID=A0ABS6A9N8_9GAMM|nr:DcaP family trimeric outer membrane transporter [Marinobacter salexigens]MBU2874667.1 porin [Marinobacter salexigens]
MSNKKFCRAALVFAISALSASQVPAVGFSAGDSKVNIYGFAKLNMIHDVDNRLGTYATLGAIDLDSVDSVTGHTQFDASHSRLGVRTDTETKHGNVTSVIEGDFNTPGGAGPFRLRHAYLQFNGIMAGQNWTNFGTFVGNTPTLDHLGQPGQGAMLRQPQLRYTTGGLSVALEQGGAWRGGVAGSANVAIQPVAKESLPDLTLRYQAVLSGAQIGASAVVRQLEYFDQVTNEEESAFGWGVNLEASAPVTDILTVRGSLTAGDGMGGYQYLNPASPAYVDLSGDVETIESIGGTLGLSAKAGVGTLNLGYGLSTADLDDAVRAGALVGDANDTFESIYLNYMWSPVQGIRYGIETGLHSRETQAGEKGDAVRLQAQLMYSF